MYIQMFVKFYTEVDELRKFEYFCFTDFSHCYNNINQECKLNWNEMHANQVEMNTMSTDYQHMSSTVRYALIS